MKRVPLTRDQYRERWHDVAVEVLTEIRSADPAVDDERLGYVEIQISRDMWLAARDLLPPPFVTAEDVGDTVGDRTPAVERPARSSDRAGGLSTRIGR